MTAIPLYPGNCVSNVPPTAPLIVVPAYIAVFERDDTVPRAIAVWLCSSPMRTGSIIPPRKSARVKIPKAVQKLAVNDAERYTILSAISPMSIVFCVPICATNRDPVREPRALPHPITSMAKPMVVCDAPKSRANHEPMKDRDANTPVWKIRYARRDSKSEGAFKTCR